MTTQLLTPTDTYAETCTCGPWNRYACGHCYHDQCLDCGWCTMGDCLCRCEHGLGFAPSDSPENGPQFWLGGHHARWLSTWNVPMCVSRNTLANVRTLPRAAEIWMCDSAAFSEIDEHGEWTFTPYQWVRELRRYRDEIGRLAWAGPQDWRCASPT
ncbi:DUF7221 family queuine tRNA-ribosyltransferase-like protein [Streptomyces cavernae]|uniref:deazapurine DNA modification protein DpdA family protein n=1 Tax=Streptomyces cavernae TaxID=2259034 RepID=UPI001EE447D5|nr:hypothetical protein [Streptomyces cavernae]